jgi:hypothetical protein
MQLHISPLLRSLMAGLALASLAATATEVVVVVGPTDPVTTPVTKPAQKKSFTSLIAAASLKQQGVTNPTTADLGAAESQVQAMRDSGMGWGAIANSMNLRLGEVVSAANRAPASTETRTDRALRTSLRPAPRDGKLAAASDAAIGGPGHGKGGPQGAGGSGGHGAGAGKGGGASNSGGGQGAGNSGGNSGGGNGGGKGGGNGGGKGGGNSGGNSGGNGGGNGGGKR